MNPLLQLKELGQSPWLDYIQRDLLTDGGLQRLIDEDGIAGVTSNPAIFAKAVTEHDDYDAVIAAARARGDRVEALYEQLVLDDIRAAADLLAPVHRDSGGRDGHVSLEVSPELAHDSATTVVEARRLWAAIDRPNAMIKVPATREGLAAIRELTALGININATLIFSPARYQEVAEAWGEGIAERQSAGLPVAGIASVASFFVSRIETLADQRVAGVAPQLRGRVAVAVAKTAYQLFRSIYDSVGWQRLRADGCATQRLLWASTSTKNPDYPDTKYVDELIGPDTVNTLPMKTLAAYRDHGHPERRVDQGLGEAREVLDALDDVGIDFEELAAQLEEEGVDKFIAAQRRLLQALEQALAR